MIILRINKNIFIVCLLLIIFAVGTMNFVDTVEAAKWKKYNSGNFNDEYPQARYAQWGTYKSYMKGNNQLYVNIYVYDCDKGSKPVKKLSSKTTFTKKNGIIKIVLKDYTWHEKEITKFKTFQSVKTVYKNYMKDFKKTNSIPPSKAAFDKQTFKINGLILKSYAIKYDKNHIHVYFYNPDGMFATREEVCSQSIKKDKNTVTMKAYNSDRQILEKKTFKTTKTVNSCYKEFIKDFLNILERFTA